MKTLFRVGIVKPEKRIIAGRSIPANDRGWRDALFGLASGNKRLGRLILGNVDGQPLALIAELQSLIQPDTSIFLIHGEKGQFAIGGPAIIHNEAGYGPAPLGISLDRLKQLVTFDPDLDQICDAIERTARAE